MPHLLSPSGRVTSYGFACGYFEAHRAGGIIVRLWREHGTYHVRAHDFADHGRLAWASFPTLAAARRAFRAMAARANRVGPCGKVNG